MCTSVVVSVVIAISLVRGFRYTASEKASPSGASLWYIITSKGGPILPQNPV